MHPLSPVWRWLCQPAGIQREDAINTLLEKVYTRPESGFRNAHYLFWNPLLKPLEQDSRIRQALARYAAEREANRDKLIAYFDGRQ